MSTIKPVTIPREVADAIEYLRTDEGDGSTYSNEMIALLYADITISGDAAVTLRKVPFDTLMRALLDGYERELTEGEAREQAHKDIRDYFVRVDTLGWLTAKEAVRFTLDTLGIVIPGVNAPETEVTANV
jgi:hypothetical protein